MSSRAYTTTDALRDAGERVRRATLERDLLIAAMHATGEMSQREIARATGLSHTAIQRILLRTAAASAGEPA